MSIATSEFIKVYDVDFLYKKNTANDLSKLLKKLSNSNENLFELKTFFLVSKETNFSLFPETFTEFQILCPQTAWIETFSFQVIKKNLKVDLIYFHAQARLGQYQPAHLNTFKKTVIKSDGCFQVSHIFSCSFRFWYKKRFFHWQRFSLKRMEKKEEKLLASGACGPHAASMLNCSSWKATKKNWRTLTSTNNLSLKWISVVGIEH